MIVTWILEKAFGIIGFCFRFIPVVPANSALVNGLNYVLYFFVRGAALFFLLVPYQAFLAAVDVVFFFWLYEPISLFIMWCLRKIPFLGIE